METIQSLNLAGRFLLELCALVVLGYWGFQTGASGLTKILFGLGAPLLVAIVWGAFVAPKAAVFAPSGVRLGLEFLVWAAAIAALFAAGQPVLAWVFLVVAVINRVLIYLWKQ